MNRTRDSLSTVKVAVGAVAEAVVRTSQDSTRDCLEAASGGAVGGPAVASMNSSEAGGASACGGAAESGRPLQGRRIRERRARELQLRALVSLRQGPTDLRRNGAAGPTTAAEVATEGGGAASGRAGSSVAAAAGSAGGGSGSTRRRSPWSPPCVAEAAVADRSAWARAAPSREGWLPRCSCSCSTPRRIREMVRASARSACSRREQAGRLRRRGAAAGNMRSRGDARSPGPALRAHTLMHA